MHHFVRVGVPSHDSPRVVYGGGDGALVGGGACAWSLECSHDATGRAYEAVKHIACIAVESRCRPAYVDAVDSGAQVGGGEADSGAAPCVTA